MKLWQNRTEQDVVFITFCELMLIKCVEKYFISNLSFISLYLNNLYCSKQYSNWKGDTYIKCISQIIYADFLAVNTCTGGTSLKMALHKNLGHAGLWDTVSSRVALPVNKI
jgi:hypothetical protein